MNLKPMLRIAFLAATTLTVTFSAAAQQSAPAKAVTGPTEFTIGGAVKTPLTVTAADMKQMPRKTISVVNAHNGNKTEVYEGVPLALFLAKAGLPQGEQVRGQAMTTYVLVGAADNYYVLYSLAELDSSFLDSDVIVADTMDGAPITGDEGPYKLVAPHDKRPARWVRMVKSITIARAPTP
jgi:DMSO/TMAO reductase YedYZ molybdopterin-dependent catalytic subunit